MTDRNGFDELEITMNAIKSVKSKPNNGYQRMYPSIRIKNSYYFLLLNVIDILINPT